MISQVGNGTSWYTYVCPCEFLTHMCVHVNTRRSITKHWGGRNLPADAVLSRVVGIELATHSGQHSLASQAHVRTQHLIMECLSKHQGDNIDSCTAIVSGWTDSVSER